MQIKSNRRKIMPKSFLQKLTPQKRRIARDLNVNASNTDSSKDTPSARDQNLSKQIHLMSTHQYVSGVRLLQQNLIDEAKECFEDALAARLVLHGPNSDQVLEVHHRLRSIAHTQSDSMKAAYHKAKIVQIQNVRTSQKFRSSAADSIDWSVLCRDD